ncbi:acyl carrier protein [Rhodospirillum rubrum]|uniref:acyl carrier protein n=1 Tax=Rhodospirillum rubrum TaxID=1085 RepID=UPI00190550AE|nr:acyl carrier protein [Rhodospirillum rubrum]MBK1662984.1 acyl carrier protein [Rhodospirillum rubrum]MBK1675271.1 acyl carrier protein [Rhodospirillum rubrum]
MSDDLTVLEAALDAFGNAPTLGEMPRRTLADKGIDGPTAAHVIEEVHTPLNLAYLTFTTGSSAFQNIVGVTHGEISGRCAVARTLFERLGTGPGTRMLVTYPPLVNVFAADALRACDVSWGFLKRSSRDALLVAVCREQPKIILGESSFLRAGLEQAVKLGLKAHFPKGCVLLTAGTPLDQELLPVAEAFGYTVHDLYGCQEFGWLTLDGTPLRGDISLVTSPRGAAYRELVVGGLPMGDSFLISPSGHVCDPAGKIITYRRERTYPEYEVVVTHTQATAATTVEKAARTILRIKGRVVKVSPDLVTGASATRLLLVPGLPGADGLWAAGIPLEGPQATRLFDDLVQAQADLQKTAKSDPAWIKGR